jgi:hypothetical protein
MNEISSVSIKQLMVHQAGNAAQGGHLILSDQAHDIPDEFWQQTLSHFFLKPFNEAEQYQLSTENNLVYNTIQQVFEGANSFESASKTIAEHFHLKSQSVFAKSGEFYMVYFNNIPFDGGHTDAIGLFHTAHKDAFLKVTTNTSNVQLTIETGIDLKKPEKGALIFRKAQHEGFLTLIHESASSKQGDAAFWKTAFLQAAPIINSYHNTNEALGMCKLFISNELTEHFDTNKTDQIDMLQRSMDYFKTHDQFQLDEFSKEVLYHPEVIDSFTQYKQQYEVAKQVNIENEFDINPAAIQKQQRLFKSILKLDKNFHVYVHGRRDLIEKGYDEKTGKHYYKLYFDQEQ